MNQLIEEILYHCRRLKKLWAEADSYDEIELWIYGKWVKVSDIIKKWL